MSKPAKILQLLQLLSHRSVVTMETISKVCGIPPRTAYRYLNTLSDANVPIYHDKERGGYCLTAQTGIRLEDLSRQELVIMTATLAIMKRHVNAAYRQTLNSVLEKIIVRQSDELEEVISAAESAATVEVAPPNYSSQLSLTLVQFAAIKDLSASVVVITGPHKQEQFNLDRLRLQFRQQWQLAHGDEANSPITNMDHVAYVSVE